VSEHRWEARACLEDGVTEGLIGGARRQLVTVCLCDGPDAVTDLGEPVMGAPVVSRLRPDEARELGFELLMLAELAERRTEARS
jgi:hypothetical protein